MLHPIIAAKREHVAALCRRHHVRRLDVFGSATSARFNPDTSDLDFLVEFEGLPSGAAFDAYFDLKEDLEALFGRSVDLVSAQKFANPYFAESVTASRESVYATV